MKFRNIFIAGLSVMALASCSDYLEVDAPSQNDPDYVFSDKTEMNNALNGIYASMMSGDTYGDKMFSTYVTNTDVDFKTNSSRFLSGANWSRYDADPDGGAINSTWKQQYTTIELANLFIEGAESSQLYNPEKEEDYKDMRQMIGEAKVMRAIVYHDLTWMFGDPAFSFNSSRTATVKIYPLTDRAEILDKLIADLKEVADDMKSTSELGTVERISKEMAWAMIARIAQTAAGYTLRPDGESYGKMERMNENYLDYYAIARDYTQKVIDSQTHRLGKPFYQVFFDECKNVATPGDDVIWEIPFCKTANGKVGYSHGIKLDSYQSETPTFMVRQSLMSVLTGFIVTCSTRTMFVVTMSTSSQNMTHLQAMPCLTITIQCQTVNGQNSGFPVVSEIRPQTRPVSISYHALH